MITEFLSTNPQLMKMKIIISLLVFFTVCLFTNAQVKIPEELQTELQNKLKFDDIIKTITSHYKSKDFSSDKKLTSEYKKWSRWGWYMGSHQDVNGNMVNVSEHTWEASRQAIAARNGDPNVTPLFGANSGNWIPIGPYSIPGGVGRTDRLAFHPTNANIIYAGTPASGMWRSMDAGANWSPLSGFLPNIGVSGIVIDKDDPNTIFVLTGDGDSNLPTGLLKSFDYIRPSIGLLKICRWWSYLE